MLKSQIADSLAEQPDDRALIVKTIDRLSNAERRCIPAASVFLSGREQQLIKQACFQAKITPVVFWGGHDEAERKLAIYLPDYYDTSSYMNSDDLPIKVIRAEISDFDSISHRDILGALMGLGIRRDVIGDIYVSDSSCDIIVLADIAPYILGELTTAGKAHLRLKLISLDEIIVPEGKFRTIKTTVQSLRLDSLVASGFQISRSKAQVLISSGKVEVDHRIIEKSDYLVTNPLAISARGLGKIKISEIGGKTRKDRFAVTIDKYI